MARNETDDNPSNITTVAALGAAVCLILMTIAAIVLLSLGDALTSASTPLVVSVVGVVVTAVPALISAAFSERASKDIRNGVVQSKVVHALEETGVAAAARDQGQTTPAALSALNLLLTQVVADNNSRLRPGLGDQDPPRDTRSQHQAPTT